VKEEDREKEGVKGIKKEEERNMDRALGAWIGPWENGKGL